MPLSAGDSLSVRADLLSVHPENHRGSARYFDWKLDPHGDLVFTPGLVLGYDRAVEGKVYSHIRLSGSIFIDCVRYPAGFAGAGALFPLTHGDFYSLCACLGAGLYVRKDWLDVSPNFNSRTMIRSGPVQWVIMPYPEIELRLSPEGSRAAAVVSFASIIYVSMLCAGVQYYLE